MITPLIRALFAPRRVAAEQRAKGDQAAAAARNSKRFDRVLKPELPRRK